MDKNYLATIVLTSSESKRLIGKAVAQLPFVQEAFRKGRIIVIPSTTNAFVVEELLGEKIDKQKFAAGWVYDGMLGVNKKENRLPPYIFKDGNVVHVSIKEILDELEGTDVVIKGANAVDPYGHAGILMASKTGGTVAEVIGTVFSKGLHFIIPAGLEKLVSSVAKAAESFKFRRNQIYSDSYNVGFMPVTGAQVITEVEAFESMSDVIAVHVASGGIGGSEGAVVLNLHGSREELNNVLELLEDIKEEPPVKPQ